VATIRNTYLNRGGDGVEGVEGGGTLSPEFFSAEPQRALRSKRYIEALYRQTEQLRGSWVYRKLITIGDFKTCGPGSGIAFRDRELLSIDAFAREFRRAIRVIPKKCGEKCGKEGFFAEVYGTVMWFLDSGAPDGMCWCVIKDTEDFSGVVFIPIAYDFVIDLDIDKNPWLVEEGGLKKLQGFAQLIAGELGLIPTVAIARGVQLKVTLLDIHAQLAEGLGLESWARFVMERLPKVHWALASKLADKFSKLSGVKVVLDEHMYDAARVTRLDLSVHAGEKLFTLPFKPRALGKLDWRGIRERQKSIAYTMAVAKGHSGRWGAVVDPKKYIEKLGFFLHLYSIELPKLEVPRPRAMRVRRGGGWWRLRDPTWGEIEYDTRLDGFGWVKVIVKERIPVPDGRLAFAWLILPVAIKGPKTREGRLEPLISEEEAVEWLKACLEAYPAEGKGLKDYIKKLEANMKYGDTYNMLTWRHLIEEVRGDGGPLADEYKRLKPPLLYALWRAGLINLEPHALEMLRREVEGG